MSENLVTGPWGQKAKARSFLVADQNSHPELKSTIDADFEQMFARGDGGAGLIIGVLISLAFWIALGMVVFRHHH